MTFIDHNSKTVWNGSRLGKEISANTFNDYWNNNIKPEIKGATVPTPKQSSSNDANLPAEEPTPFVRLFIYGQTRRWFD